LRAALTAELGPLTFAASARRPPPVLREAALLSPFNISQATSPPPITRQPRNPASPRRSFRVVRARFGLPPAPQGQWVVPGGAEAVAALPALDNPSFKLVGGLAAETALGTGNVESQDAPPWGWKRGRKDMDQFNRLPAEVEREAPELGSASVGA
jgi:hypothetical protein